MPTIPSTLSLAAAAMGVTSVLALTVAAAGHADGTAAPPASAAAATKCRMTLDLLLNPGISTEKAPGTNWSARRAPMNCDGPVLGTAVSGPGATTSIAHRNPGSSCLGGDGWGTLHTTFPIAGGKTKTLVNTYLYSYGGIEKGLITGSLTGDYLDGTFSVVPLKGDCVADPLSKVRVDLTMTMHPYSSPR